MNLDLLEQLLYDEESNALDFKSEQYKFVSATDSEKSELLKDVLAFANSWCRTDAHILVGVKEVKGGRSEILGITTDLDDADLQQFVNKKTNRPVAFSYRAFATDAGSIGVITVPRQDRPFYLKRDYGRLKADTAYVRRGSSTDVASLDEVTRMRELGGKVEAPTLDLNFRDRETGEVSKSLNIRTHALRYNEEGIPWYGSVENPLSIALVFDGGKNRRYYFDYAKYETKRSLLHGFDLQIENTGSHLLSNVRVKLSGQLSEGLVAVDCNDYPTKPQRKIDYIGRIGRFNSPLTARRTVAVTNHNGEVTMLCKMGDVQPKDTIRSDDDFYLGGWESGEINLVARVFADNLPEPAEFQLIVNVDAVPGQLDTAIMIARLDKET